MAVLRCLLKRATKGGYKVKVGDTGGYKVKVGDTGGEGEEESHLFFIDGTLVFCEASEYQMVHYLGCLCGLKLARG